MAITATAQLNSMLTLAVRAGVAQDQMARFLRAGYVPQPVQLSFHAAARLCDQPGGPTRIGYGGTRGQAKTHAVLSQVVIDDCDRFPGLKWLFLRKIGRSALESFEDLIQKILFAVPHQFSSSRGLLTLDNGSKVVMGGFKDERDIDAYVGIEYDGVVIEDATTLSKSKIDMIRGSLRTSKPGWRPREYYTANPGGVGHAWFKQAFVDPWQQGREGDTRFIHTTMGDNVFINPEYVAYLNGLVGWLKRAWRDGDFSISAGQFFTNFDPTVHVVEPFDIPQGWQLWCAMDYGLVHWNVVHFFAMDGDGNVFITDEHAARRWLVPQHAEAIRDMLWRQGRRVTDLWRFVAGPDVFAEREGGAVADKYAALGIHLSPAKTDRISGAAEVAARLGSKDDNIPATVFIFNRCTLLIECLPLLQHDPHRPDDVLKVNADAETGEGGDDYYDDFRYGLMEVARTSYGKPGVTRYA